MTLVARPHPFPESLSRTLDIRECRLQKIPRKPHALLIRNLKAISTPIIRIIHLLRLLLPGMLSEEHNLAFTLIACALLEALEITKVVAIHGEDEVEG